MPSQPEAVSPDTITLDTFNIVLARYPSLIDGIDASKPNPAKKSLKELDAFRYEEAPALFSGDKPKREMQIEDVQSLVEWKLRHGKFRPTLMKLVSGNDPSVVKDTVRTAIQTYRKNKSNPQAALDILVKLKGIGPATASLLLTVHDPERVIFFSDEAFYWLCGGGQKVPLKYNAKEYVVLREAAGKLQKRLDVSATDVEKVAYVLLKAPDAASEVQPAVPSKPQPMGKGSPSLSEKKPKALPEPAAGGVKATNAAKPSSKRKSKAPPKVDEVSSGLRRSKRAKT
ncbi:hypothetical protein NLU13_8167 [Sarocladium strictum]|uniref:DUF1479 domain protein n=1 Tax=Sarocladium strictum TaxID=5046 RepID=A0AA39L4Q4_SARSR|nr:hypothetical protein NLU13_8167 [Sarocladium strictum]